MADNVEALQKDCTKESEGGKRQQVCFNVNTCEVKKF